LELRDGRDAPPPPPLSIPMPDSSQPLGEPLPCDEHACSVSLPTWSAVVGYEEGDPGITNALKCGYPRFVYHPYVLELMGAVLELHGRGGGSGSGGDKVAAAANKGEDCLVLPTEQAAQRCRRFLLKALYGLGVLDNALDEIGVTAEGETLASEPSLSGGGGGTSHDTLAITIRVVRLEGTSTGVHAVLFPAQTKVGMEAKAYWQHTGEVVSSRRAEQALLALLPRLQRERQLDDRQGKGFPEPEPEPHSLSPQDDPIPRITSGPQIFHCSSGKPPSSRGHGTTTTGGAGNGDTDEEVDPYEALRAKIGGWARVPPSHVFLTPSGMASIYTALRSARRYRFASAPNPSSASSGGSGGGRSIVYGFPYLDTLKLCSRSEFCPDGVEFFGLGDEQDLENLRYTLRNRKEHQYCALFTEVPSNPLLQCPDLVQLRELSDEHDFCLVVDDTISNFLNSNLIESGLADAVCTSLTKLVSGRGDAMAGSLVANPNTPKGRWLQRDLQQQREELLRHHRLTTVTSSVSDPFGLFSADARAVLLNSADFPARNNQINATAEGLADWLHGHPDVERVYYPKLSAPYLYQSQVQKGGFGGLMSVTLPPHMCQRTFYDCLDVAKGPSLGTNFTLVCPYTLLAHYHELDFAISCNVPPNLLRISVGLEPLETLKAKFETALQRSRLHPRVCSERLAAQQQQRRAFSSTAPADLPCPPFRRSLATPALHLRSMAIRLSKTLLR
jgi:cystathionine gamma-synthase